MSAKLGAILSEVCNEAVRSGPAGRVADYIPELATVSPDHFGVHVVLADGTEFGAGDNEIRFSLQSVTKLFTLSLALGRVGDNLWSKVGREPSGSAFNSIVQLEHEEGRPRNPFINAGALVVTDTILAGRTPKIALAEVLQFIRVAAGDEDIYVDKRIATSETAHGHRNLALANFMAAYGIIQNPIDMLAGTYFHQCAIAMSCRQLARAGRYLIGSDAPGPRLLSSVRVRRVNAIMMTCGLYDESGDFAFRVGFPAKSGVGGGVLAVVPGLASIAVWSPGLNKKGNSTRGIAALERLSEQLSWSLFGSSALQRNEK